MANDAKIPIATLIERESANGNRYFSGIMGAARVVMFRDRRDAPDGSPVWMFYVQDSDREPWHPAAPADGGPPRQAAEAARRPVDESEGSGAATPANSGRARQRVDYEGASRRSGGLRPAGDVLETAMAAQAPHSGRR